jgi:predicted regulator of Ras-like GTPase activity (Roadblock/LC7/MglB family)
MDAGQALAELTEISSQIELALIFDARGELVEATLGDRPRAESLAFGAAALLACSTQVGGPERGEPIQVELTYPEGSLLIVREGDLRIMALTSPDPIAGLAFFELRACLRKLEDVSPRRRWRGLGRTLQAAVTREGASGGEAAGRSPGKDADDATQ